MEDQTIETTSPDPQSEANPFKFRKGDRVSDKVTKFEGIITARTDNLIGCVQYLIEAESENAHTVSRAMMIDEARLKFIDHVDLGIEEKPVGGPAQVIR